MSRLSNHFYTKSVIAVLLVSLVVPVVAPTKHAEAFPVVETGPNVVQNTVNATANTIQTGLQTALNIKELTLDGIAYGITRTIIQSMVRSIVNWINSGFQGSPAFITDLEGFLKDIADQVIGEAIYGSDLAFLCSPFQLDVKIALATQYNKKRDGYQPQCTLSQVTDNIDGFLQGSFSEGGWQSWFELTQGEANDPNKAYYEAELAIDAKIRNAQGQEIKLLEFGDGFLSFKVCSDTQAQSGAQKDCTITTPGRVIADQLNKSLGAGQDSLITADEINEIIGALLAQLAQQALTGVYGLLGLGGNSSYSNNSFGPDGNSSYLDALENEVPLDGSQSTTTRTTNITNSIVANEDYLDLQYEIISRVEAAQQLHTSRASSLISCGASVPPFPSSLTEAAADARAAVVVYEAGLAELEDIRTRFLAATDPSDQNDIIDEYLQLQLQGSTITQIEVTELELFITYDVRRDIDDLASDLERAQSRCDANGR